MRIRKYYRCDYSEELYQTLTKYGVKFSYDKSLNWIMLYLFEDHPYVEQIKSVLPKEVFSQYVFTDSELMNSDWLLMRSTNNKLDNKNLEKSFELSCKYNRTVLGLTTEFAHHRKQIAPYEFSTPIKWGGNHFYSSVWGGYHNIFCDDIAMRIIKEQGFSGVRFDPVIAFNKKSYAENIHQMVFTEVIADNALILNDGFQKKNCSFCGKVQYIYNNLSRIQIKKSYLGDFDFYRTNELFGDGFADPFLIVSNRVFRALTQFNVSRNLEFVPLLLK